MRVSFNKDLEIVDQNIYISMGMKSYLLILFLLYLNPFFGQNLKIEIVNDTIKKMSYYDQCNIVYSITNTSDKEYYFILDSKEFNEDPEYNVELFFIGLPDYYVYEENRRLNPGISSNADNMNTITDINRFSNEFSHFREFYSKFYDDYDMRVAYRISKNIVQLKPKETKLFRTDVNFPRYRLRYYNMVNKGKYYFQIGLHNPKEYAKKYLEVLLADKNEEFEIFTGQIFSNKIPLIYEVYNNK